jgi:Zn-dependent peptidase ImmA (M78 family)
LSSDSRITKKEEGLDEMIQYSRPRECGLSKQAVDALAARAAAQLNYEAGQDLEPIVEKLGGRILIRSDLDMTDQSSGSIRIRSEGDFEIILAQHTGLIRDRFTIGHELGHYVLHYLFPKQVKKEEVGPIEAQRYGSGRVEWEANWFAAGFLMPADPFSQAYRQLDGDEITLAAEFKVSSEAAKIRISTLGLSPN